MNRCDAELLLKEFANIGERELAAEVVAPGSGALFVTVCAADCVAVVAVGDHYWLRPNGGRDSGNSRRVADPLNNVSDTILVDALTNWLAFGGEQFGETCRKRQAPNGRQVRFGGTGEVEPIGLCLRRGLFVGKHTASAFVDNLERADDSNGFALGACFVGELHAIQGETR